MLRPLPLAALCAAAPAAEISLLSPAAEQPPPALSAPSGGRAVAIDRATLAALEPGDAVLLEPLPGRRIRFALEPPRTFVNGDIGWRGTSGEGTHILALVHNARTVLGTLTSPWGAFDLGASREAGAGYVGRLSAAAAGGGFRGAGGDAAALPLPAEFLAQTVGAGVAVVVTPSARVARVDDTVQITIQIVNNLAVPLAGESLRMGLDIGHAHLTTVEANCQFGIIIPTGEYHCWLPVIAPGATFTTTFSMRVVGRPPAIFIRPRVGDRDEGIHGARINVLDDADPDVLADADGDGQSDFNEGIVGTDPADPGSVIDPDAVSGIDVAFLYTPGFEALPGPGSPETRINQAVELANAHYAGSGAPIAFRPVLYLPVDYALAGDTITAHRLIESGMGVFRRPMALATAAGADTVVLFDGRFEPGADACARATFSVGRSEGHILHDPLLPVVAMYAPGECDPLVLTHELGHTLGLGHDRLDPSPGNGGVFPWARGHGVEGVFRTIMANWPNWPGTPLLRRFSSPDSTACRDMPCGAPRGDPELGADAVFALNHLRFQAAARRRSRLLVHAGNAPAGAAMYGAATRREDPETPVAVFDPGDRIDLGAMIVIPPEHQGETGETYIVADAGPDGMHFLDRGGAWRRWPSPDLDTLGGNAAPRPLGAVETLAAFSGLRPLDLGIDRLSAKVYFAYAVPDLGVLAYTRDGVDLVVRPRP